jgi:hypothetical protein
MEPTCALILLSCSNRKRTDGERLSQLKGRSISEFLSKPEQQILLQRRNEIRRMLGGGPPRLYNEDQKGGYRDERLSNKRLRHGPDFGGDDPSTPVYLPAHERYAGRFFAHLLDAAPTFWKRVPDSVEIVFVSALYGLVLWDEPIQEYDCHFADYATHKNENTVKRQWGKKLTEVLCDFIETRAERGFGKITKVYDLLSESLYQNLLDWKLVKKPGVDTYHRVLKGLSGPDALTSLATILPKHLTIFAGQTGSFEPDVWYDVPGEIHEDINFGFEAEIGKNETATREGDLEESERNLRKQNRWFRSLLSTDVRRALILAEHSWRKAKGHHDYEWGSLVVSFAKPVERYFKDVFGLFGNETLGLIVNRVQGDRNWGKFHGRLRSLNELRIRGAHITRPPITQEEVPDARKLVLEILGEAVKTTAPLPLK